LENELRAHRIRNWEELAARAGDPFALTKYERTHLAQEIRAQFGALAGRPVRIAGRLMSFRRMGKASFAHLQDASGQIQIYFRYDDLGAQAYNQLKLIDLGDFLGVEGHVFRTRTGEITVHVHHYQVLAKALRPLPEKYHGLTDVETRYRQRYLDLLVNPGVRRTFETRTKVIRALRHFLDEEGFWEVETPILQPVPGGATARPFVTHHQALDLDLYLRIAPELYLKRLIIGGFEKVYEISRNFRNEGIDPRHNPEFTMLEAYQAYADYHEMMNLVELLIVTACEAAVETLHLEYQGQAIDLTPPWPRVQLYEALAEHTGIDFRAMGEEEGEREAAARRAAEDLGVQLQPTDDFAHIVDAVLKKRVVPRLIQPTFLIDYPVELSPLAKRKSEDPTLTERFQPFIGGLELGNAFSELNNPLDQRARFEAQLALRQRGLEEAHRMDEDFLVALEHGMPPTGGLGLGIDRLVMLLTDAASIRDVILFPQMRPVA